MYVPLEIGWIWQTKLKDINICLIILLNKQLPFCLQEQPHCTIRMLDFNMLCSLPIPLVPNIKPEYFREHFAFSEPESCVSLADAYSNWQQPVPFPHRCANVESSCGCSYCTRTLCSLLELYPLTACFMLSGRIWSVYGVTSQLGVQTCFIYLIENPGF